MVLEKRLYGSVTEPQLVQFIEQWMNVLSHLARFTRANRLVAKNVQALFEELPAVMDDEGKLEFTELHNSLLVNGAALSLAAQDSEPVAAFLFVMLKHNLRRLRLERGVSEERFFDLLDHLAQPVEHGAEGVAAWVESVPPRLTVELQVPVERKPAPVAPPPSEDEEETPPSAASPAVRPGELPVVVLVRVGALALYGASVAWSDDPASAMVTQGDKGCTLYSTPGEREIIVRYDEYQVRQGVGVRLGMGAVDIDLQKIFDYGGS